MSNANTPVVPAQVNMEAKDFPMIYKLLPQAAAKVGAITKEKRNAQQGFNFRGIDDVLNAVHPVFAELGITPVPQVIAAQREERTTKTGNNLIYTILSVAVYFYAPDGTSVKAIVQGEAMDSADKSSNKAMSAAYKYACFQVLSIPTEEMEDADATTPEPSKPKEYNCYACGKPFEGMVGKDGKSYTGAQVYHMSERRYGKPVCPDCVKEQGLTAVKKA